MKIAVVLVGNSKKKLKNLEKLYQKNKPLEKHKLIIVYNGKDNYTKAIKCKNDKKGRDAYMYYQAVKKYDAEFYFFMNDDIVYIKDKEWLSTAIRLKAEIVGVQPNLSAVVSTNVIKKIAKRVPTKWIQWGDTAQFIRTSAFGCTRDYFLRLWEASDGNAQKFEKRTLKIADSYAFFNNPFYIHDSNLAPYYKYFKENGK